LIGLTDIEDKSLGEAEEGKISVKKLTQRNEKIFFNDVDLLRMNPFTYIAKSSTSVNQAASIIKVLLEKKYAYFHEYDGRKNIYFDTSRFKKFGRLAKIDLSKWPEKRRRFHKDTYRGMRWNKGDFVLWHGYKEGDRVFWDTIIGKGRPSWNVQDPAMITQKIGYTLDVACGGVDNLARHHDYNIAVSEAASDKILSRYWLHGEHLLVDGKKMSKSSGNVIYPTDLVLKGYTGKQIRFFLIYKHYRKKSNFTFLKFDSIIEKLAVLKKTIDDISNINQKESSGKAEKYIEKITLDFEENLNSDLDVKGAFDQIYINLRKLSNLKKKGDLSFKDSLKALEKLRKVDNVLKVFF
jgi:cysteinyl-tRNA synthetase